MIIHAKVKAGKRKGVTKAQREQYQQWLRKHNSTGEKYEKSEFTPLLTKSTIVRRETSIEKIKSLDTGYSGVLTKSGIMGNYHKLSKEDREIVEKVAMCTAPTHKGAYTYVTEGMNPASLGRKNEVL